MNKNKKTCFKANINKTTNFSLNKKNLKEKNNYMNKKSDTKNLNCNLHVMPPQITDQDISALFNGVINIVKKKIELENKAQILNANLTLEKTLKALKEKESECIRLKNEIINLKAKLTQI